MKAFIRVTAVFTTLFCVVISLKLAFGIVTLGFAIGGWTGLKDYQQALLNAQRESNCLMLWLLVAQIFGGVFSFVGLRGSRLGIRWLPLFVAAFPVATFIVAVVVMSISRS